MPDWRGGLDSLLRWRGPMALVLLGALTSSGASQVPNQSEPTLSQSLQAFVKTLQSLRAGDESLGPALLTQASALCELNGRCDTLDVARYYLRLTPQQRAQGLRAEQEYRAMRKRVINANPSTWPSERESLYQELRTLAETVEGQEDVVPAAQTWAFLARIELNEYERSPDLTAARRSDLLQQIPAHIDRSLALFRRAGQVTPRLEPLWLRGRLARARQEPSVARRVFDDCFDLAGKVGQVLYQERALAGLIDLAKDAGNVRLVDEYLAAWAQLASPSESWPLAREHAARLLAEDRCASALSFLTAHPPQSIEHQSQWHGMLAVTFIRNGDLVSARREVNALGEGQGEFAALAQASLALAEGEPAVARTWLGNPEDRVQWSIQGQIEAASLLGECWLDEGRAELALPVLTEALDLARKKESSLDNHAGSLIGEWVGVHTLTLLARAHGEVGDPLAAAQVIEDNQSRRLRPAGPGVDVEEIKAWAARFDRGFVSFGVGANETVVVWVTQDGAASLRTRPLGRRSVSAAVRRLREAIIAGDANRLAILSQEIAAALLPEELQQHLLAGPSSDTCLFLLHGPLESLPLSVLHLEGEPLDENLSPIMLPGLPQGTAAAPLQAGATWNLLGSPLSREGRTPLLPGAARELAQLAQLHTQGDWLSGTAFVRPAVIDALSSSRPLHIATHLVPSTGCADGRLAPVGLLLTGADVLCASQILDLAPRLPLVVLSACETAGGRTIDAEGAHGVARAFLEAGTRELVVTLWPVSDRGARVFALQFHRALTKGASPASATRQARRAMRDKGHSPADWAAFRTMGRD